MWLKHRRNGQPGSGPYGIIHRKTGEIMRADRHIPSRIHDAVIECQARHAEIVHVRKADVPRVRDFNGS